MNVWIHSTILATGLAATVAVGIAAAAVYDGMNTPVAPKADRLPITATETDKTVNAADAYVTVETRSDGMSVLSRVPLKQTN